MTSILHIFKLLLFCISPKQVTQQESKVLQSNARFYRYFGGIFLLLAIGALLWSFRISVLNVDPPKEIVNISNFTKDDMQGVLGEVNLSGILHFNKISNVHFPTEGRRGHYSLVPITDDNWEEGEPLKAFVSVKYPLSIEGLQTTLEKEQALPSENIDVIAVQKLMADSKPKGFFINVADVFRQSGLNVTDDVVMLEIIEKNRSRKIKTMYEGSILLSILFTVLGMFFFGIGYIVKLRLKKFE